jgi:hypothetical protein
VALAAGVGRFGWEIRGLDWSPVHALCSVVLLVKEWKGWWRVLCDIVRGIQ